MFCIFLNDIYYRFLPKEYPNYILNFFNARSSGNKLDLHIDSHTPNKGKYLNMIQLSFVIDTQNKKNGCTIVVPKSHNSGTYSNRKTKNIKYLQTNPGDLVLWDSRLWHGTHENYHRVPKFFLML